MSEISLSSQIASVDNIIIQMGLTKAQDTPIGLIGKGISGGERKRLSLASELLFSPSLLFADEPTSGLDSSMAESVVQLLKNEAMRGCAVLV